MDIKRLVETILEDGKLSQVEFEHLKQTIAADGKITPEENEQIDVILDKIDSGQIIVE